VTASSAVACWSAVRIAAALPWLTSCRKNTHLHLRVGFGAYGALELTEDRRGLVGRAVIDNNNLNSLEKLGLGEDFQALEARIHQMLLVVSRDDYARLF